MRLSKSVVDEVLLEELIRVSRNSNVFFGKHASCVITKNEKFSDIRSFRDRVVCNYLLDRTKERGLTVHAEVAACMKLPKKQLKGSTVIVVRFYNEQIRMSKPCLNCQKFLDKCGVDKVLYSLDFPSNIKFGSRHNHSVQ
jgi:deoxycytidylate deaminase